MNFTTPWQFTKKTAFHEMSSKHPGNNVSRREKNVRNFDFFIFHCFKGQNAWTFKLKGEYKC